MLRFGEYGLVNIQTPGTESVSGSSHVEAPGAIGGVVSDAPRLICTSFLTAVPHG